MAGRVLIIFLLLFDFWLLAGAPKSTRTEVLLQKLTGEAGERPLFVLEKFSTIELKSVKEKELAAYLQGEVYFYLKQYNKALGWYDSCIVLSRQLADSTMIADCRSGKGYIFLDYGNYELAFREYQLALAYYEQSGTRRDISIALHNVATSLDYLEQDSLAIVYFSRSIAIDSSLNDFLGLAKTHSNIGWVYLDNGLFEKSFESFIRALEIYTKKGEPYHRANVLKNISRIFLTWDDLPNALKYLDEAMRLVDTLTNHYYAASVWLPLGDALVLTGEPDSAEGYFLRSLQVFDSLGYPSGRFKAQLSLGKLYTTNSKLAKASFYLGQAYQTARGINSCRYIAECQFHLGKLALITSPDSAMHYFHEVEKNLIAVPMPELAQKVYLELANTSYRMGQPNKAFAYMVQYNQLKDSLFAIQRYRTISEIQARYQYSQIENLLQSTQKELEGERRKNRVQWVIILFALGGFIVVAAFLLVIFRLNRRLVLRNQQLNVMNREIALQKSNLELAKQRAEQSDTLKSAFLANMSHEIRTPINGISGFSKLLVTRQLTPEKQKVYAEAIISNSQVLLRLINDIIDISKIEANSFDLEMAAFPLKPFLTEVYHHYQQEIAHRNKPVNLILSLSEPATDKVFLDKDRLGQIFRNLIDNSIKFTSEGDIEFGYTLTFDEIIFYVRDSGIGIGREMHASIFERFRQVETGNTRRYSGSGLGLAISQGIVKSMKGRIWLESDLGKGAVFYFAFPRSIVN